jgi:integrase
MAGRQAKFISATELTRALKLIRSRPNSTRDEAILLLSVRAGLRACEIARLEWSMVLDPRGRLTDVIEIHDRIAKKRSGRRVPMHPQLKAALRNLLRDSAGRGPVICSQRGGAMMPNSIVNLFVQLYRQAGAAGCSSHSGRRTFITTAARSAHKAGASLRDVQLLAGHQSIETTQRYIEGDSDAQRRLVFGL